MQRAPQGALTVVGLWGPDAQVTDTSVNQSRGTVYTSGIRQQFIVVAAAMRIEDANLCFASLPRFAWVAAKQWCNDGGARASLASSNRRRFG